MDSGQAIGNGNTAEELEAIAVGLLRTAQAIRKPEFGTIEVGNVMYASVVPDLPEYDDKDRPILEAFNVVDAGSDRSPMFRQMADELIAFYRS